MLNGPPARDTSPRPIHSITSGLYGIPAPDLGQLVPPAWIIKKHVVADSLAMLYGPSGVGKSFVALDMGLCVATGRPWQGFDVRPGLVLYVAGEGKAGINARIIAWCKFNGVDVESLRDTFIITSQPVPFLDVQRTNELLVVIDGLPSMPVLIIVDTLNRNFGDGDENSTKDASRFIENLERVRRLTGACVMPVHHTGKGGTELARGSSTLRAAMDTEMYLKHGAGSIRLVCSKQKDAAAFNPTGFDLEVVKLGFDDEGEEITSCVVKLSAGAAAAKALVSGQKSTITKSDQAVLDLIPDNGIDYSRLRAAFIESWQQERQASEGAARKAFVRSYSSLMEADAIQAQSIPESPIYVIKI